ncbi:hypothetical protein CANARDRAFT_187015, partial [[Candida] arabinofermentans NRRL YB-2248]
SQITIPDLRFQESFKRTLQANAVTLQKRSSKKDKTVSNNNKSNSNSNSNSLTVQQDDDDDDDEELPPISTSVVIYTIIKDQIIMQFVQGFGYALLFLLAKPWLMVAFQSGRSVGSRFIT